MRFALFLVAAALYAQDAREIVRQSVERDQANWLRMRDYTWTAQHAERQLNGDGRIKSEQTEQWETVVLDGEPHRRILEKNGKPLSTAEARKQQEKLDAALAKLKSETAEQRRRRLAEGEKQRRKEREFLREIPELYEFQMLGEEVVDGRPVWIIGAKPRAGYRPKHGDAKALMKIEGKLWIDKTEYQWVRLEAETTDTLSFALFLARLAPGAKLVFEQTRINNELWLPKHSLVSGTARLGLVKKISMQEEIFWSNYRKFHVDSKIVVE
ncbi:MAG: hypothetical protein JWO80_857 [Bryobacterales bacterium]|nr:hypothetical protein [Bryobacterales bacterium]